MQPVLYFSRNYNPRLAVAAARYLRAPVRFEFAAPFAPGQAEKFLRLNPNQRVPILVDGDDVLWEADAIACRLAMQQQAEFWPTDTRLSELVKWLSWGYWNFVRACDLVHWERVTKRRYDIGPTVEANVANGLSQFRTSAAILSGHLATRTWLLGDTLTYADFRMACVLHDQDLAGLPVGEFPALADWRARLAQIEPWRDPFQGLDAPPLPEPKP